MDENRFLYSFHPEEQLRRLKEDFKFMFVRHPFERLLSAYRDKEWRILSYIKIIILFWEYKTLQFWWKSGVQVSKITDLKFLDAVWPAIVKGNDEEIKLYGHLKDEIDYTQYNAALQAYDIAAFHTFVHYLVKRHSKLKFCLNSFSNKVRC